MTKATLDAPIRTSASQLERILSAGHPTLVVFEVSGCEPCASLAATLDSLAREYAGRALVVRVGDADQGWLAARYHLFYVPTLLFWHRGGERARIKGDPGRAAIGAHLEFMLTGVSPPVPASGPRHTLQAAFDPSRRRRRGPPAGLLAAPPA